MLKLNRQKALGLVVIGFIFAASFLGTTHVEKSTSRLMLYVLPNIVDQLATYFYISMIFILSVVGFTVWTTKLKTYFPVLLLMIGYLILLAWSLVSFSDSLRYMILFFAVALCPAGIFYILERSDLEFFAKILVALSFFFISISAFYSFLNYSDFPRVYGIYNNPNLFGMWIFSCTSLLLCFERFLSKFFVVTYLCAAFFLVLLTGSRLAFVLFALLLIPSIWRYKVSLAFVIPLFFLVALFLGAPGIEVRSLDVTNAVSDSGRNVIWLRALACIAESPLIGHGMSGAQDCVGVGNVHNSYLRLAVMLGLPLALVFVILYFGFIGSVLLSKANIYIKLYFIGLPFAFFGEDYVVGVASPFFPFFILMLAILMMDLKSSLSFRRWKSL